MNKAKFDKLPSLLDNPNRSTRLAKPPVPKIPTEKMEKFVEALLGGMSKQDASRAAGAPGDNDAKLLRYADAMLEKPAVQDLLQRAREAAMGKMTAKLGALTVEFVETEFLAVYEEARLNGDRPNALRALENLGKYLGMFKEKTGGDTYNTIINTSPDQVNAELERLAKAAGVEIKVIEGEVLQNDEN